MSKKKMTTVGKGLSNVVLASVIGIKSSISKARENRKKRRKNISNEEKIAARREKCAVAFSVPITLHSFFIIAGSFLCLAILLDNPGIPIGLQLVLLLLSSVSIAVTAFYFFVLYTYSCIFYSYIKILKKK